MKKNNKGFTLAELLIVVAIIAVLVAIAIPIFNSQLEKSREATDIANIRDYYAEISVGMLDGGLPEPAAGETTTMKVSGGLTATRTPVATGKFTVTVAGTTINQKDLNGWAISSPNVSGVAVAVPAAAANTSVEFEFTIQGSAGSQSTYLSAIAYKAP